VAVTRLGDRTPEEFETVDHPGVSVLARPSATPWVRYVLESGLTLHEAAGNDRASLIIDGRKPVFLIPAKLPTGHPGEGKGRWAVRRFARGGRLLPILLGDRYLAIGTPRPLHEAAISEEAQRRGIPTPVVVAAAVYSAGIFYRGDLVTELVSNATDLMEALFDTRRKGLGGAVERLDSLRASGGLIRTLARAGLQHGDLHAGNILLQWEGVSPNAFILDLGLSRFLPEGTQADPGPMFRRLRRSLRKWEGRTGLRLSHKEWAALDEAAGA
jgi:3-deoxy-D-manno-octulosonic acid kinase